MKEKGGVMSLVIDRMEEGIASFSSVEGLIGAGKSKLLEGIKRYIVKKGISAIDAPPATEGSKTRDLFLVMDEPVNDWSEAKYSLLNSRGEGEDTKMYSYLELFYKGQGGKSSHHLPREWPPYVVCFVINLLITVDVTCCYLYIPEITSYFYLIATYSLFIAYLGVCYFWVNTFWHTQNKETINPWAFDFQVFAFTTRLNHMCDQLARLPHFDNRTRLHIISERSLRTDRLFFKNLYESGKVPQHQWLNYESFHDIICRTTLKKTGRMIFVDTSPTKAYDRIIERAREAESKSGIPLAYLESLRVAHQEMVHTFVQEKGEDALYTVNFEQDMLQEEIDQQVSLLMKHIIQ